LAWGEIPAEYRGEEKRIIIDDNTFKRSLFNTIGGASFVWAGL
jgi:hypothetical protein